MNWTSSAVTDLGRHRSGNEDAFLARDDIGLFAVADGMGGHAAGEVASSMAIQFADRLGRDLLSGGPSATDLERALPGIILEAHRAIQARTENEADKAGMGTTLTLLAAVPDTLDFRIAHVGDSRGYLFRDGHLRPLTTDHTLAAVSVAAGQLSRDQARSSHLSSILTRCLGGDATEPAVDLVAGSAQLGDLLLLCSDGLTGMIGEDELEELLARDLPLAQLTADLVTVANRNGGTDNITAVLIRAGGDRTTGGPPSPPQAPPRAQRAPQDRPGDAPRP